MNPVKVSNEGANPASVTTLLAAASLALALLAPQSATAEVNGEELLEMMRSDAGGEVAQSYIDDVRQKMDGALFCLPDGDPQQLSFDAVKEYLETHPEQLFRARRYLIVQGLRGAFPCKQG